MNKFIRTVLVFALACGLVSGFPLTSSTPSFKETFTGNSDSFDLNLHSLTLMPYQTTGSGDTNRCHYSVRPIRSLPVDMAGSTVTSIDTDIVISGLPTIYGIALSKFQIKKSGEVVLFNSNSSSSITLRPLKSDAFQNSAGFLILEARRLMTTDGRLAIQFDYDIDPEYWNDGGGSLPGRALVRNVFQLEIFPGGMVRYSYFSVDVTYGEVGLISSVSPTPGGDLDYSAAMLKARDLVKAENGGSAAVLLEIPVTEAASCEYASMSGSAIAPSDFTSTSGSTSIGLGAGTANLTVPIVNDTLDESPESFSVKIHALGNPNWIYAEPRIWILDDDNAAANSGPRIDLAGNRVIILPPDPSNVTITGFRLLTLTGGTLVNPIDQSPIVPNSIFNLEAGAVGLIASGLGIQLTVEAIHSSGTSIPSGFDLDGNNAAPVFSFVSGRTETSEGGFASIGVNASQTGASVSYQMFPLSAQPESDYAPMVKTLEFKDGLARIEIPVFSDKVTEGEEEFVVRLINPSPGSFIGPASRAKVVIKDAAGGLWSPSAQVLPDPRPSGRVVNRIWASSQSWRFVGEPFWRLPDSHGWNVREGLHQMGFRADLSVPKLYLAPDSYLNQQSSINDLDFSYSNFTPTSGPSLGSATGSLQVELLPVGTTGQWRRVGETTWRNSGSANAEANVPVGTQLVEFKDTISGYDGPSLRPVRIFSGSTSKITAVYQVRPASGVDPAPMTEPDLRSSSTTWSHIPISTQDNKFNVSFEFKPLAASFSWIGLSPVKPTAETGLMAALRANLTTAPFSFSGLSGAIYGGTPLTPVADQWHFVQIEVDRVAGTYNLYVTPPTGARVTIRTNASFRSATSEFNYLSMASSSGSHSIRGLRVEKTHVASTNNWKIVEFPDQTTSFDLALELKVRTAGAFSGNPFQFLFGISDGRANDPSARIGPVISPTANGPVVFPLLENTGAVGRYPPTIVRLHVDLVADTYDVRSENGAILHSGPLSSPLAKANHLYLKPLSSFDVAAYSISDSILPPAFAPPTGTGVNLPVHWTHLPITPQTGRFSLTCDIRPVGQTVGSGDLIDSLVGLSSTKVDLWNQISVALRAKLPTAGGASWDAYSSTPVPGGFIKEGDLPIVDGKLYHAVFHVDIPNQTFRVEVSPADGGPVVVLEQAGFRLAATELRYLTLRSVQGRLEVSNVRGPLPHPLDSPAHFVGQVESPNGFGTGTVVSDHAVLTSARLVFDTTALAFTPGITWRRSGGGYAVVPDACEPSHVVLATGYAAAVLNVPEGDVEDVAALAFRPLDVPESDNAPGGGCFSGFLIDDGSGSWTSASLKNFTSFPVTGITAGNSGKIHATNVSSAGFSGSGILKTATGVRTPPGTEGAAMFVQGADKIFRPAAVCIGSAGGVPRFRSIDSNLAEAIHQANSYQRQPGILQDLVKGGVYYIPQSLSTSADPNRAHILSNAIPPTAKWTLKRYNSLESSGGQAVSVDPGSYLVTFGAAPSGYTLTGVSSITKNLTVGTTWNLPAVYTANPPSSYDSWVDANFDEFEASSPVAAPSADAPWLGVDNLTAYAFGFDPNAGPVRYADPANWTPGYPLVTINPGTSPPSIEVEMLRRMDPKLAYQIQYADAPSSWITSNAAPQVLASQGVWERVKWTFTSLPGQTERKFVRMRVVLAD